MRDDDLVEVYRVPRPLADVVAGLLRSHGIDVLVSTDDMAGVHPDIGFSLGARLLVRATDAERAEAILEDADAGAYTDPSP